MDSTEQWNMSAASKLQKSKHTFKKNRIDMQKFVVYVITVILGKMVHGIFKQIDIVFLVQV